MPQLVIRNVEEPVWEVLQERAQNHGRTAEAEASAILCEVLSPGRSNPWQAIDAHWERLAASGRDFGDSTEMLREDRER